VAADCCKRQTLQVQPALRLPHMTPCTTWRLSLNLTSTRQQPQQQPQQQLQQPQQPQQQQ
jgi:hypothetical protein